MTESAMSIICAICAALVLACCVTLVLDKDYEDGLFGRLGLALLAVGATARCLDFMVQLTDMRVSGAGTFVWMGLALFLCRHLYRFRRYRSSGEYDWRHADRRQLGGKGGKLAT